MNKRFRARIERNKRAANNKTPTDRQMGIYKSVILDGERHTANITGYTLDRIALICAIVERGGVA